MARTRSDSKKTNSRTNTTTNSSAASAADSAEDPSAGTTLTTPGSAYETIRQKIIEGEFYPSQRLIEAQLAESLGFSRHNVRTALDRLASGGLVRLEPNRGATVATLSLDDALDNLLAREALEAAVTRLAAARIDDAQIEQLGEYIATMREALAAGEFDTYSATNVRFHKVIHEAAGNRTMPELIATLRLRMSRLQLRSILIPGRSEKSMAEHEAIYEGLARRDAEAAAEAAAAHLRSLRAAIDKAWNLVRL